MSTVFSVTLIALALIVSATFAVCFHVIDQTTWVAATFGSGGAAGLLHLVIPSIKTSAGGP